MTDSFPTRPSLLIRLKDQNDQEAWSEFVQRYAPIVYRFARKCGLQDADADDLTQDVFRTVSRSIERFNYDPGRGAFRSWLMTVARTKLADLIAKKEKSPCGVGDTEHELMLQGLPAPKQQESIWETEYREALFRWAATQVQAEFKDKTWQAFWKTAVEGKTGDEVAAILGISVGAVYIARSRVLGRMKQIIAAKEVEDSQ